MIRRSALVLTVSISLLVVPAVHAQAASAEAETFHSIKLSWSNKRATKQIRIYRLRPSGALRLVDIMVAPTTRFVDDLLWSSTRYAYRIKQYNRYGKLIAYAKVSARTPAQINPLPRPFSRTSLWNVPIVNPAIDSNSSALVNRLAAKGRSHSTIPLNNSWGRPIAYADAGTKVFKVGCKNGCDNRLWARIPAYARPQSGSDGHLVVVDRFTGNEVEMWDATKNTSPPCGPGLRACWSAASRYKFSATGWGAACPWGYTGCPASPSGHSARENGTSLLGGVIRPEEIRHGLIPHAIAIGVPKDLVRSKEFIACPATASDGPRDQDDPSRYIPQGARIQLDPTFVIPSTWPRWLRVVAKALQVYGGYISEKTHTGGPVSFEAEASSHARGYDSWAKALGVKRSPDYLYVNDPSPAFPWHRFRVLKILRNMDNGICR
jgi:hypothetical protein